MTIQALISYVLLAIVGTLIIWRIRTNPVTQIRDGVINGDIDKVRQCLKKGVDVDIEVFGGTPLFLAVCEGNKEMAEFLVNNGADINQGLNVNEGNASNPLLEAAVNNHTELVEFFLARGAVVGIHFAAFKGDIDTVKKFIEQNVQINSKCRSGTPLNLAIIGGHKETVSLLLDNGADISLYSAGGRPLDCAIRYNRLEIAELLIERGGNINSGSGSNPLRLAVSQNKLEILKLLTKKGADINSSNLLHLSASKGYIEIAEFLLINGLQINARDTDGKTPLHHAASEGHLEMAEFLINNGAKVNSITWLGDTPLSEAKEWNHEQMERLLKSYGGRDII